MGAFHIFILKKQHFVTLLNSAAMPLNKTEGGKDCPYEREGIVDLHPLEIFVKKN
jgi:hypothetical protein